MSTILCIFVLLTLSAAIGHLLCVLGGRREWSAAAPAVGFAALLAAGPVLIGLPGGTLTFAVLALAGALAGALLLRGASLAGLPWAGALVLVIVAWLALPFFVNGRFGMLGVSFNDDTRFHLWAIEYLRRGQDVPPEVLYNGYPLGPHAIAGAIARCLGAPSAAALNAVLAAGPLVTGLAAYGLLETASRPRRLLVGLVTALPYLVVAYYGQGAFKETILAALLLAFTVALREQRSDGPLRARAGIPLGVLVAGAIAAYTYPAVAWFAGVTVAAVLATLAVRAQSRRPLVGRGELRAVVLCTAAVGGVLVIALAPKLDALLDSFSVLSTSPAGSGSIAESNIGNLVSAISTLEVFGQWPNDDFRYQPHGLLRELMTLLGISVAGYGLLWWTRRRDVVVPAAAAAALAIFLVLRERESAYIAAKALAVAAPLVIMTGIAAITERPPSRRLEPLLAITAAFVVGAGYSSFVSLRSAQVGASAHERELASFQPLVAGQHVLYLSNDNFTGQRLFGAIVTAPPVQAPVPFAFRAGKAFELGDPLDFDSMDTATLDRFAFVVTSAAAYASTPPPNFRLVRSTPSFRLWQRTGPTPDHQVLPTEGTKPAARLDCTTAEGSAVERSGGEAVVVPESREERGPAGGGVGAGYSTTLDLKLPAGRQAVSIQYRSPQELVLSAPGGYRFELPPNLDGAGPYWPAGVIDVARGGTVKLALTARRASPVFSRSQFAVVPSLAFTPVAEARKVPVKQACGDRVDWYGR